MVRNKHNTPGIIKYPFWQMTTESQESVYACLKNINHMILKVTSCIYYMLSDSETEK